MSQLIQLVDVLEEKKGALKEAHLILFEYCNLRCSFCHQDHESKVGMSIDAIIEKTQTLLNSTDPKTPYVVNVTGGEIFLDEIDDSYFDAYEVVGKMILDHFSEVKLVWGTNLVYTQIERVERLIHKLREYAYDDQVVELATSYDPAGRFNPQSRALFFTNLEKVGELVGTVNVVITKQNIQTFLSGNEGEEVAEMVKKHNVYFDHYIPSDRYVEHQPDEGLIGELYMLLADKYPQSYPIKDWKLNRFNDTTCRSTKIINKDGVVTTCWSEAGKDSVLEEQAGLLAKNAAEERFLNKYGCLSCEYYSRCGLRCFLHHSFIDDGSETVCQIKLVFDQLLS